METYGMYKGKQYPLTKIGQRLILKSTNEEPGFTKYVDVLGKIHEDLFVKEVKRKDLEKVFQVNDLAYYKGEKFDVLNVINDDTEEIELFTMNKSKAEKLGFIQHDQLSFRKTTARKEVELVKEYKDLL
ncbi:hypothetical protein [Jeotgalibacillus campisalis]|uniref:Uncharacterized protein n=1 Tax=Jeotgalibacillus campisalis TaxID=220754 RepID=A0A0C2W373_9BACL|nr:hypothetical protein [Jeotgalibacillus campisalis]KIL51071.1 hypothetical protein KR50_09520 [Jeotgalibacillus campisalis]